MRQNRRALAVARAFPLAVRCAVPAGAQTADRRSIKERGVVTIRGGQPTSLPTQ